MVFAIGDLHFDSTGDKPMGIFGENWKDHEEKIICNWNKKINDEDLVLIPGDISWALKLEEAEKDLKKIDSLPGKKIMSKGNHDYWWSSLKKLEDFNFKTIEFIQNNSVIYENIAIVGTRGWKDIGLEDEFDEVDGTDRTMEHDEKIFNRELHRLRLSLDSIRGEYEKIICMLHYPPFNSDRTPNEFGDVLEEYEVDICIYGHLHGEGHRHAVQGLIDGVEYVCVASDFIDFNPKRIL